jgi:glycosyltransferase involved in cell wall biosynthesis
MTAGPTEIIGGGFMTMESVSRALGRSSKLIEKMALTAVKLFDLIVVRGSEAKEYLKSQDITLPVTIITGSVNSCSQLPQKDRNIHLIFVGRLSLIKQIHQFIEIVSAVKCIMPHVKAVIVGDGPMMSDLQIYAEKLELKKNIEFLGKIENAESILSRSQIFVLTSKSEGLSIAMAEGMAAGTVPVVADVGELSDLVIDGVNGYLVKPNCIDEYTKKIISLLQYPCLLEKYSLRAIEAAKTHCDISVISMKWQHNLQNVISQASGFN